MRSLRIWAHFKRGIVLNDEVKFFLTKKRKIIQLFTEDKKMIIIKYFGHSMWSINTNSCNIIIDPYTDIGYNLNQELIADVVISSHDHFDHNNFKLITPPFQKVTQIGRYQIKDSKIQLIEASHGKIEEKSIGDTFLIHVEVEGVTMLHCGDLGEVPDDALLKKIGEVDILFIPVGGYYTIDANLAKEVIDLISPKIVFPMHYKTDVCKVEHIAPIDAFHALYPEMEISTTTVFLTKKEYLKEEEQRIIKLQYEQ